MHFLRCKLQKTSALVCQTDGIAAVVQAYLLSARSAESKAPNQAAFPPIVARTVHAVESAQHNALRNLAAHEQNQHLITYCRHRYQTFAAAGARGYHAHPLRLNVAYGRHTNTYPTPAPPLLPP